MVTYALPKRTIAIWKRYGVEGCYRTGEMLFYQEHRPYGIFIILEGSVVLLSEMDSRRVGKYQMLGLRELIKQLSYPVSAMAKEAVQVIFIHKKEVLRLLQTKPKSFPAGGIE